MKRTLKFATSALLLIVALSCDETTIVKNYTGTGEEKTYSIEGYAQKGPFVVGSSVTISELNDELYPTGRVFFSTILTDEGYFEIPGVILVSPYVQIKVEGRFFGETTGAVQVDELVLYSIADLRETQSTNVNIITHLIKNRIEELVQEDGQSLKDAKQHAFEEFLQIFNWEDFNVNAAEELNLEDADSGGAILLAVSTIFDNIQAHTVRVETITNFQYDFKDGDLDSDLTKSALITSAKFMYRDAVNLNLENFYGHANFADFTLPMDQFIENSDFINYEELIFPESFNDKENLLRRTNLQLNKNTTYYISVIVPAGMFSDIVVALNAYTASASNTFTASPEDWEHIVESPGSLCPDSEAQTCYQKNVFIHPIGNIGDDIREIQIPISFSGSGKLELTSTAYMGIGVGQQINKTFTWN